MDVQKTKLSVPAAVPAKEPPQNTSKMLLRPPKPLYNSSIIKDGPLSITGRQGGVLSEVLGDRQTNKPLNLCTSKINLSHLFYNPPIKLGEFGSFNQLFKLNSGPSIGSALFSDNQRRLSSLLATSLGVMSSQHNPPQKYWQFGSFYPLFKPNSGPGVVSVLFAVNQRRILIAPCYVIGLRFGVLCIESTMAFKASCYVIGLRFNVDRGDATWAIVAYW